MAWHMGPDETVVANGECCPCVVCAEACDPVDTPNFWRIIIAGVTGLQCSPGFGEVLPCANINGTHDTVGFQEVGDTCEWYAIFPFTDPPYAQFEATLRYNKTTGVWTLFIDCALITFIPLLTFDCTAVNQFVCQNVLCPSPGGCNFTFATVTVEPL